MGNRPRAAVSCCMHRTRARPGRQRCWVVAHAQYVVEKDWRQTAAATPTAAVLCVRPPRLTLVGGTCGWERSDDEEVTVIGRAGMGISRAGGVTATCAGRGARRPVCIAWGAAAPDAAAAAVRRGEEHAGVGASGVRRRPPPRSPCPPRPVCSLYRPHVKGARRDRVRAPTGGDCQAPASAQSAPRRWRSQPALPFFFCSRLFCSRHALPLEATESCGHARLSVHSPSMAPLCSHSSAPGSMPSSRHALPRSDGVPAAVHVRHIPQPPRPSHAATSGAVTAPP